jgi:hypothetical protein
MDGWMDEWMDTCIFQKIGGLIRRPSYQIFCAASIQFQARFPNVQIGILDVFRKDPTPQNIKYSMKRHKSGTFWHFRLDSTLVSPQTAAAAGAYATNAKSPRFKVVYGRHGGNALLKVRAHILEGIAHRARVRRMRACLHVCQKIVGRAAVELTSKQLFKKRWGESKPLGQ